MEITQDLIQKFFENKCDKHEFDSVMAYLTDHPAERERFFSTEEWNDIHPDLSLNENDSAAMLSELKEKIFHQHQLECRPLRSILKWTAIAASFILFAGGVRWLMSGPATGKSAITQKKTRLNRQSGEDTASAWIVCANRTGKTVKVYLPDSSLVKLKSNSSVKYQHSFGLKMRDVYLDGEALFEVTKNRDKPFTVFSGVLATTALGTSFLVKVSDLKIKVKLYTGKVLVRPTKNLPGWKENVLLSPGEQVLYNKTSMQVAIGLFKNPVMSRVKEVEKEEQELVFNNSSLKEVIQKLSGIYHHKINFNDWDITGMNFTGTISRSDSLAVVLRLLATMNGLEVKENGTTYTLSKPRE